MTYKKVLSALVICMVMVCMTGTPVLAAEPAAKTDEAAQPKPQLMGGLSGTPINVNITGGVIVPKGMLLTALNFSYRDKSHIIEDNGSGARKFENEIFLLKLRYSPSARVEIAFVPGFINNNNGAFGALPSSHVYGMNDAFFGATYMFLGQKFGDPLSATVSLGVNLPTGQQGANHPAGGDAWGVGAKAGITKVWHPNHRIDSDIGISKPMETGNIGVQKGYAATWNGSYHYVFSKHFDVGVEFALEHGESWKRNGVGMNNKYTELYAGPTANFCIPSINTWFGAGVFFPVFRDVKIPTAYENVRIPMKANSDSYRSRSLFRVAVLDRHYLNHGDRHQSTLSVFS